MVFPRAAFRVIVPALVMFGAAASGAYAADGDHQIAAPTGAAPSDVDEAKARFAAGRSFYEKADYARALAEFQAGFALTRVPAFLINSGLCHKKLGDKNAAREDFRSFLQMDPSSPRKGEVEKLIAELGPADNSAAKPTVEAPPADDPAAADLLMRQRAAAAPTPTPARPAARPSPRPAGPAVAMAAPANADDDGESLISSSGSRSASAAPAVRRRAQPVEEESDEDRAATPIYRKAWFWGVVGAAVLAGVAGAFLATRTTTESGTLGTIDAR